MNHCFPQFLVVDEPEFNAPFVDELIAMLVHHGGDACVATAISLIQFASPIVLTVLGQLPPASHDDAADRERWAPLDNCLVEKALLHMKEAGPKSDLNSGSF